jgi:hypothetical protein
MDTNRLFAQIDKVDKSVAHKIHKGISFARIANNDIEYVNIPSTIEQRFVYLENTSKLTKEERDKLYKMTQSKTTAITEADKLVVGLAIDKHYRKQLVNSKTNE